MANYHNLLSKCDRALMAYIIAGGSGTSADTYPAKRSQDRDLPCTICYSESCVELAHYSATYSVKASIIVRSNAPTESGWDPSQPKLDSDARVAQTFDLFHTDLDSSGDKLADDITAAARALATTDPDRHGDLANFTLQNIKIAGIEANFEEGSIVWNDTLNLVMVACPANVDDPL